MKGQLASLNAASASAVVFYENLRQKKLRDVTEQLPTGDPQVESVYGQGRVVFFNHPVNGNHKREG